MSAKPHLDKLNAALSNPKCVEDVPLLNEVEALYSKWVVALDALTSHGKQRVVDMVSLLNEYKDVFEVELVMKRGSDFLRRQKGQLKLDNSILEEFLIRLVHPEIIQGPGDTRFITGPQNAFMSLSFRPRGFNTLDGRPEIILKTKDQDFVLGTEIHYKFSSSPEFQTEYTAGGSFVLAVRTDLLRKSRWQQNVKSTWTKLCSKKLQELPHV